MGLIILALAVSLDGMWAGLGQGLRGRRTTGWQLAAVGLESAAGSALALLAGAAFAGSLGERAASWLAAAVFLGIGLWNLREALRHRHLVCHAGGVLAAARGPGQPLEWSLLLLMGASVTVDASLAACALAMAGLRSPVIPPLFGLAHVLLVGVGNTCGHRLATRAAVWSTSAHHKSRPRTAGSSADLAVEAAPAICRVGIRLAPGVIFLLLGLTRMAQVLTG